MTAASDNDKELRRIARRTQDLRKLVDRVNGFIYQGDRLNAVLDTVAALRSDRALAARLLDLPFCPVADSTGCKHISEVDLAELLRNQEQRT